MRFGFSRSPSSPGQALAERKAANSNAFLREVDEAVREEAALAALRRYGRIAGVVVIAGLIAFGAYLWWDHATTVAAEARAERFALALDQLEANNLAAASTQLAPLVASDARADAGDRAAARLLTAAIAQQQGKAADAARLFDAVRADSTAPAPYRDVATLRAAALGFDTIPADHLIAMLRPLAVPGKPWFGSAGELLGFAYLKQGRKDLAAPLFGAIAREPDAPENLRARARQIATELGVDVRAAEQTPSISIATPAP